MAGSLRVPSYRHHRPTGQAVVTLGGKDYYLGKHGSDASHQLYRRQLSNYLAGRPLQTDQGDGATVAERQSRGEELGLSYDELAFDDALTENQSAREAMENFDLKKIAEELTSRIRSSVSVDWRRRESARATIRIEVKKILKQGRVPAGLPRRRDGTRP